MSPRLSTHLSRLEQALEAQGEPMEQGFARMDRMDRRFEHLIEITQGQGQQMLAVVQQLAQVVDRLVPDRDR